MFENKKTVAEVNPKGFKTTWKKFDEAYNKCHLEGKETDSCKRVLKELNIEIIE